MAHSATLLTDEQIPIAPAIQAVHKANGNRIRALLQRAIAANRISLSELARETAIDNSQITRFLSEDGPANIPPAFIAAVMAKDTLGVFVGGLCSMVGREAIERKPDPAAENKVLRAQLHAMRDELDRLLGGAA